MQKDVMTQPSTPPDRPFEPYRPDKDQPFDNKWLCHLLRRGAFRASAERLAKAKGKEPYEVVDWLLEYDPVESARERLLLDGNLSQDAKIRLLDYMNRDSKNAVKPFKL